MGLLSSTVPQRRFVHIEKRIKELGITLPKAAGPRANYDVICQDDETNVWYVSGHLPFQPDGTLMTGRVTGEKGRDVEYGYQAARHAALNIISTLSDRLNGDLDRIAKIQKVFGIVQSSDDFREQHLVMDGTGTLDRIAKIQKVFGIVQSSDDFREQHLVMDGASDVFIEIFGKDVGYHARSAIGTSTLPLDITVEIEAIVKLLPALRFKVGAKVQCKVGPEKWAEGTVAQLRYTEPDWERSAPYQIHLDDGRYIFAPEDSEAVIRAIKPL
eukprot:CAMPEP_0194194282 /NCGR_PEP_ID=MMETSP0154-20130528/75502_1 /TAXON_ID=1049557 /ORGANISM="Thalassiothrix antarctica, Strain L6-D1" /LENGTH=270 /DNA_ID=CAMNT_0038918699 /DNA_START=237 /DNA_END=1048 /DNA_ORIENTATION=+